MIRKVLAFVVLVPLAVVIVALAVANRGPVAISLDPLNQANPAYVAHVPLYLLVFLLVIVGVLIGGVAAWLKQSHWRRRARRLETQLRRAYDEIKDLRSNAAETGTNGSGAPGNAPASMHAGAGRAQPWPAPRALPPAA